MKIHFFLILLSFNNFIGAQVLNSNSWDKNYFGVLFSPFALVDFFQGPGINLAFEYKIKLVDLQTNVNYHTDLFAFNVHKLSWEYISGVTLKQEVKYFPNGSEYYGFELNYGNQSYY